jgi:hypothetical protein
MKTTLTILTATSLALSLSACGHAGPSDTEVNQAFSNFGWTRVGLSEAVKDKVHAKDCTPNSHDTESVVCQITVDGFPNSKANIPFKKAAGGSWAVNL